MKKCKVCEARKNQEKHDKKVKLVEVIDSCEYNYRKLVHETSDGGIETVTIDIQGAEDDIRITLEVDIILEVMKTQLIKYRYKLNKLNGVHKWQPHHQT